LPPTLGTAAVVWAGTGTKTFVTRLLSMPAVVFTGKISYSWYLWHFPLLAFANYLSVGSLSAGQTATILVVSLVIAVFSYFYIEQPVRRGKWRFGDKKVVFAAAGASMCLYCAFGSASNLTYGFPNRMNQGLQLVLGGSGDFNPDREECTTTDAAQVSRGEFCKFGVASDAPTFLLWGDSHAEALRAAFNLQANESGKAGIFAGRSGCAPVVDVERSDNPGCRTANEAIMKSVVASPSIETVILAARWGLWSEGTRYKREEGNPILISATTAGRDAGLDNRRSLALGLERTIIALQGAGKRVWLIGPVPEVGYLVPKSLYVEEVTGRANVDIRPTVSEFERRQHFVRTLFDGLAKKYSVKIISPETALCDDKVCQIEVSGRPLYSDDHHMTVFGAKYISPIFAPIFR
jgi:uncharacterized protein (DUF486 family)